MKRILIVHSNMEPGGAETSLLGLLQSFDYSKYRVDLMLSEEKGELLSLVPKEVNLIKSPKEYSCLVLPIKDVLFKHHNLPLSFARLFGKIKGRKYPDITYATKQFAQRYALPFLPKIKGKYDAAISFIDPHYTVLKKVDARIKLGWLHTDFSRIQGDKKHDEAMWNGLDYIVSISDSCKEKFDGKYPKLAKKSIVVENVLSFPFVKKQADLQSVINEMPGDGSIKLLSVGRFTYAKNFDNVPEICKLIRDRGLNIKWYLVGYGGEEELIRTKIKEASMEEYVIILGKKDNPYPYIKACDVYAQPSRYEGKCVAVREAQMLAKPVIITDYSTSESQLENGIDGVIVPTETEKCAKAIAEILQDKKLLESLSENCKKRDYSNKEEIQKLFDLMG